MTCRGVCFSASEQTWHSNSSQSNKAMIPAASVRSVASATAKTNFPLEEYTEDLHLFNQQLLQETTPAAPGLLPALPALRPRPFSTHTNQHLPCCCLLFCSAVLLLPAAKTSLPLE
jgi:hypothetical protein